MRGQYIPRFFTSKSVYCPVIFWPAITVFVFIPPLAEKKEFLYDLCFCP